MNKFSRLAGVFACAAMVAAAAGCATNSSVTPGAGLAPASVPQAQTELQRLNTAGPDWITKDGVTYHRPHYMGTVQSARHDAQPGIQLTYGGGRLLYKPKMYLIFWGFKTYGDPNKIKPLLVSYGKAIGGSPLNNVLTQYTGTSGSITNPHAQYGKAWNDNATAVPAHPTDSQIAAEALLGVQHFGYDPNGSYVVATPHGRSSTGFGSQWCAYHSSTNSGGNLVSYTDLPYMPDAGGNCGANIITAPSDEQAVDEGMTIVEGHEYAESVTDPDPFSGWNSGFGEIGDLCAWTDIQNDPFKKKSYSAQPEYSNATSSCVHSYP